MTRRAVSTLLRELMLREEKVAPCFVRQLKPFPEVRTNRVESMKT